ncbi:MAG TPA: hypothetical protein VG097_20555 [Gemmata sp.]|jgi:hypothetical protein|nr:hypothetical protein [Gemmata sp.]
MFRQIVLTGFLICLAFGCGKKTVKNTGSSDSPPPSQQTASNNKGDKADKIKKDQGKPNWLDPNYKKEGSERPEGGSEAGGLPGKPGIGFTVNAPPGGWEPGSNPSTTTPPSGGTASTKPSGSSTATSTKPVTEADMKEIFIFIENRSGGTDKMPSIVDIQAALSAASSHAADLIKDGSIVLTGARTRESVWAYEKKAKTQGGWVVSHNGVVNVTAAELASMLPGR